MEITLVVVDGKTNKNSVKVPLPAVVGRSRQATLTINHNKISRQHCELCEHQGAVLVRDKGSLNGTFVNGQPVKESLIMPGEKLGVGPLTFLVLYETAAQDIKLRLNGGGTVVGPATTEVIAPPERETENQPTPPAVEDAGPSLVVQTAGSEPAPCVESLLPPEVDSPPPIGQRLPDTQRAAPEAAAIAQPPAASATPASADSNNADQPGEESSLDEDHALRAFLRDLGRS